MKPNLSKRIVTCLTILAWTGVIAFLVKWFLAYQSGNLDPGSGTAWSTLVIFYVGLLVISLTGICFAIRGFRRPVRLRWQAMAFVLSLV